MDKDAKVSLNVHGVTETGPGLTIGEIDKPRFEELGLKLRSVRGATQFWIGDWGNAVKEKYGKGAMTELAEVIGYEPRSVWQYTQVAAKYDSDIRMSLLNQNPTLSFSHFQEAMTAPSR